MKFVVLVLFVLAPQALWAQSVKATVINDGALVYRDSDFDSPVITTLKAGAVFNISKGQKGPFHKIRIRPGSVGWIADTDVKPGVFKVETAKSLAAKEKEKGPKRGQKSFFATRYRGPTAEFLNYTEDTLGQERHSPMMFYGFKINGYNTMFDGDIYADVNFLFHFGAPDYYQETTGKSADGYIIQLNFLLQTVLPQSKYHLLYYGFGPMFKYSHYSLEVPNGAGSITYAADDMNLGAVFDLGLAFRVGSRFSLRTEVKYYWEQTRYFGGGLSFGAEF